MVSNKEKVVGMNQHVNNSVQIGEVSTNGNVSITYYEASTLKENFSS